MTRSSSRDWLQQIRTKIKAMQTKVKNARGRIKSRSPFCQRSPCLSYRSVCTKRCNYKSAPRISHGQHLTFSQPVSRIHSANMYQMFFSAEYGFKSQEQTQEHSASGPLLESVIYKRLLSVT